MMPAKRAMAEVVAEAWPDGPPDWVEVLAREADETSQAKVAKRLGRSNGVVSQVLRNCYPGSMPRIEELVRGQLMAATRDCPALRIVSTADCQRWRERSEVFPQGNPERLRMFRACNRCPVKTGADGRAEP